MNTTTTSEVTGAELLTLLRERKGAFPVTIHTRTRPKLLKGAPRDVTKTSVVNGMANFVFQSSVRRHVDPDFQVSPRSWGKHDPEARCVIHHNGKLYMELKVERVSDTIYRDCIGRKISPSRIAKYLPSRPTKPVDIKAYGFDSIAKITFNGASYTLPQGE